MATPACLLKPSCKPPLFPPIRFSGSHRRRVDPRARRLTKMSNNLGESVEYTYNALGNVTATTTKGSAGTIFASSANTFDELGRLIRQVGGESRTFNFTYDKTSELASVKDPRSNTISYGYDSLSRLIRTTERDGGVVNLTRNAQDAVTTYQDPRSISTTYVRNGFGEVIRETSPDRGTTDYDFDARGLMTKRTDGRGVVTNYAYDNAGRITAKTYPAATAENVTYVYDDVLSGNRGRGRLTRLTDQSGTLEWVYNAKGYAISQKRVINGITYNTAFTRNTAGLVTSLTYPSGRIVRYGYDSQGRVNGIWTRDTAAAAEVAVLFWAEYLPFGSYRGAGQGNGLDDWRTFDREYRINQIQVSPSGGGTALFNRTHPITDGMNIGGLDDQIDNTKDQWFTYDSVNRLATATVNQPSKGGDGWGQLQYTYDRVSNRLTETEVYGTTVTNTYTYPTASNRLTSITQGSTTTRAFTNDNAGNVTKDIRGSTTYDYVYNNRNRLSQVKVGGVIRGNYLYDGMERLARREVLNTTPSGVSHFHYDNDNNVLAETTSTGAVIREYIWLPNAGIGGGGKPVAVVDKTTATQKLFWVTTDHLDRPVMMTDSAKAVVWRANYKPFGEVISITGSATLDMRFPGQWFQLESGLHYNWHRQYDASTGRYTQPDPLGFVDGPSVYGYALQNPLTNVDPTGQFVPAIVLGGICVRNPALCATGARLGAQLALNAAKATYNALCAPDDPCQPIYDKINRAMEQLKTRSRELKEDKLNLPAEGPFSVANHREKFQEWQRNLRKSLHEANESNCSRPR
jgi:RHS repeat-associated protein